MYDVLKSFMKLTRINLQYRLNLLLFMTLKTSKSRKDVVL